jgi:hypothetical protein
MFLLVTLWLFFSYLAGSIPFGYLIARASGKDILKIGWRKTSGSNVFENVGKIQGVLTGVLDFTKGYFVVYWAKRLGFSTEIQIFSGMLAIIGHNWSIFLNFAGGRGIATFIGAFLALSPAVLGISIIPFILLAFLWNSSIGTLLFLAFAILFYFWQPPFLDETQAQIGGLFAFSCLTPILIKRLSPISELSFNKKELIRNRLLFDNDQVRLEQRINVIFKKVKEKHGEKLDSIKSLAMPLLLSPKIGWRVAKFGVKMAQKPIAPVKEMISNSAKMVFGSPEKIVTEITAEDFKKMMIAAAKKIVFHQEEINRINFFPVADKDTGYNLAATLLGIEGIISRKEYYNFQELARDIKEAAMMNARGNAGMIFAAYLIRVLDHIRHLRFVNSYQLAVAMKKGIKAAYQAIYNPVEGTILDVVGAAGGRAWEIARVKKPGEKNRGGNIIKVLEEAKKSSELALEKTKEKLEVLRDNDVVDAGALGFVKILEAWLESLKGITFEIEGGAEPISIAPEIFGDSDSQKEVVFSFLQTKDFNLENFRKEISILGNSIDFIETEDRIKIHIHTNFPEQIRDKIKDFQILEWKMEDIIKEEVLKKKAIGLIVGETADLPRDFLERNKIEIVPFKIKFPEAEKIEGQTIYEKMEKMENLPTTSAAVFGDYLQAYKKSLERFEKIMVITLSARLSGAYSQARIARSILKKPGKERIYVFDCFTASVAEGLVTMYAQKLISEGKDFEEILAKLKEFCPKVNLLGCLADLKYVVNGGRLKLPKPLLPLVDLAQKIGIKPLFILKQGKAKFLAIRIGKNMAKILASQVEKMSRGKAIEIAIAHADNFEGSQELKKELEKKEKAKVLFVSSVSPVIGVHTGPGALIVAFYPDSCLESRNSQI